MEKITDWLIAHYTQERITLSSRFFKWMNTKYMRINDRLGVGPPSDIDYIRLEFWSILLSIYVIISDILPQGIVYPIFWFAMWRYKHHVNCDDKRGLDDDSLTAEKKAWCKENKIKAFWFYELTRKSVMFGIAGLAFDVVGFVKKEDAMAFKLRWT